MIVFILIKGIAMFKKLTLIVLCAPWLQGMTEVKHSTALKLTLQNGTEVEAPSYLAELSGTLRDALKLFGNDTPISLPLLTESDWQLIREGLPLIYSFVKEKTTSSHKILLASLRRLSVDELQSCLNSADYLAIPVVIDACLELCYTGQLDHLSFEELYKFFPHNVHEIVLRQACAKCGPYDVSPLVSYCDGLDGVSAVCVMPSGNIVSGSSGGTVSMRDENGAQLSVYEGLELSWVKAVCVTPDGSMVAACDMRTVRMWDIEGNQLAVCEGHEDSIYAICGMPDNKIVSGSADGTVRVWDTDGTPLAVCRGHVGFIRTVCVTPDGKIVSGSDDGTVRIWDREGNLLAVCEGDEGIIAVCVTPDGKIVSGSSDGTVRVWDTDGTQLAVCRRHEGSILAVCVTPDGKIVSGSSDQTIRIWDTEGNQLAICRGHEDWVQAVCITPDGMIVSGSLDKTVRLWDQQGTQIAVGKGHNARISAVCATRGGKVVSRSHDGTMRVWDTCFPLTDGQAEKVWLYLQENPQLKAFKQDCWMHIKKLMQECEEPLTNEKD